MRWVATALGVVALAIAGLAGWIWLTTNFDATGGKGWSLIGAARSDDLDFPYAVPGVPGGYPAAHAIFDPANLGIVSSRLGLHGSQPVDFENELVLRAVGIGSGSCPLHLDDVRLTDDEIVVDTSTGFAMACTGDAVPYSFLVRIDRDQLPEWPLHVEVKSDGAVRVTEIGPWLRDRDAG